MLELNQYQDRYEASTELARIITRELKLSARQTGVASLVVPGGSTPELFLQMLAAQKLEWGKIKIATTDERQVPLDHHRSNARLIKRCFLDRLRIKPKFIALDYMQELPQLAAQIDAEILPATSCVLGMGNDAHTASLFPGFSNGWLNPDSPQSLAVVVPDGGLEARITMTASALLQSRHLHVLIFGARKLEVLQQAASAGNDPAQPISCILHHARTTVQVHYAPDV